MPVKQDSAGKPPTGEDPTDASKSPKGRHEIIHMPPAAPSTSPEPDEPEDDGPAYDPEHCPTPDLCFPAGFPRGTVAASCIHGTSSIV